MRKKKKSQMGDESLTWIIWIIVFLMALAGLYFLLNKLGVM